MKKEHPDATRPLVALAVAAHPDDIEFTMAGTLLRLKALGMEVHMWNLANGMCGTAVHERDDIARIRSREAEDSARIAGAGLHPPIADDLAIFYEPRLLARVAAVVREVKPDLILTHAPEDYMEDHTNTCRLVVTAAFSRGMLNFSTDPPRDPWAGKTSIYHAMPHGLRDGMRRLHRPEYYVDIKAAMPTKREMLAQHRSQEEWLDASQAIGAYVNEMESMCKTMGAMSGVFEYAEAWRRHSHLGFCPEDWNPLADLLGAACHRDPQYEKTLGDGF